MTTIAAHHMDMVCVVCERERENAYSPWKTETGRLYCTAIARSNVIVLCDVRAVYWYFGYYSVSSLLDGNIILYYRLKSQSFPL